jgi:hypothetical protein
LRLSASPRDSAPPRACLCASLVAQLDDNLACLARREFTPEELAAIDGILAA